MDCPHAVHSATKPKAVAPGAADHSLAQAKANLSTRSREGYGKTLPAGDLISQRVACAGFEGVIVRRRGLGSASTLQVLATALLWNHERRFQLKTERRLGRQRHVTISRKS